MISRYGLFWKESDVLWKGWRGTPPSLLGRERVPLERRGAPTRAERANAKNYADFVGLYCLYGEGKIVYVGEAGLESNSKRTIFSRLKSHRTGSLSGRWDRFSWFGVEDCSGQTSVKLALQHLEAVTIAIINPGFNRQSGAFSNAHQVYQVSHEEAYGDILDRMTRMEDTINQIYEQNEQLRLKMK